MKQALALSIILHAGLWAVLWNKFQHTNSTPLSQNVIEVGMQVLQQNTASPKKTANRTQTETATGTANGTVTATATGAEAVPAPASVTITDGDGSSRAVTIDDYRRWVMQHNDAPAYPRQARVRGEQGRVVVRVVVLATGSPIEHVLLESSSGSELLDQVALEAAREWKYPPFRGELARVSFLVPFRFSLDDR